MKSSLNIICLILKILDNHLNSVVCNTPKQSISHDISGFDFLNSTVDGKSDDVDDGTLMPQVIRM